MSLFSKTLLKQLVKNTALQKLDMKIANLPVMSELPSVGLLLRKMEHNLLFTHIPFEIFAIKEHVH
jgi:hypothetical protein